MVVTINKGDSKKVIEKKLKRLPKKKGFDAFKYLGTLKVEQDAMVIQKNLRDGWKKRTG